MSVFFGRRIWFLPAWEWNTVKVTWVNYGACPACSGEQNFAIIHDDSYKIKGRTLTCLVSCANPQCGEQIRLFVDNGDLTVS